MAGASATAGQIMMACNSTGSIVGEVSYCVGLLVADEAGSMTGDSNGELDSPAELEKKHICRIITKDFPKYFAVVSRIKQENDYIGPGGGVLTSESVPMVRAAFPPGALTKKIRVGLQAQPVPEEIVHSVIGNRASFSPIVTVEPRRRKFHKPITMTIPVPPRDKEVTAKGRKGDHVPCLRLLCSITGGTSPAQWEDITGTTPLSFVTDYVSFTTNVSARFWLADCQQVSEIVALATLVYKELICVPYFAKFVVFAKPIDLSEAQLRCFCITDDKVDKTLEQQENFEEVARSKDIEISEGKLIYVHCYGNLSPVSKISQQLVFTFYAFKENRLALSVKDPVAEGGVHALVDNCPIVKGLITRQTNPLTLQVRLLHFEEIPFFVISSPTNAIILGFPWLQRHDPQVSWKEGELTRWSPYCLGHCIKSVLMWSCLATSIESPSTADHTMIPQENEALCEVFSKERATQLPPHRPWDCAIDLLLNAMPPKCKVYPLLQPESKPMNDYIEAASAAGYIQPSTSPAAAGLFFV
ncbi:hypothetical protein QTP70_004662 [Hemibagrus guttatus]|uniref:ZU5 domain-containing protein n=1 Tax=Hemibagrus guttatus TaxID=175788 RepID=A0AAE0V2W6_9TELE|nr:hypothetical protein QTP70_004662 [Hemibagrus guttatus]